MTTRSWYEKWTGSQKPTRKKRSGSTKKSRTVSVKSHCRKTGKGSAPARQRKAPPSRMPF